MKNIPDRLSSLSPARRALLEQMLKRQKEQFNTFPVSSAQQSMWVLHQLAAEAVSYTILGGLHLEGPLHLQVIQRALTTIVNRHEVLRTTFPTIDGRPVQAIEPPGEQHFPLIDLAALPTAVRTQVQRDLCGQAARRPFHLASGPLLRTTLLRLAPREHLLLLEAHHIVVDGWSLGVLTRELTLLYEAYAGGRPSPLPPLPIQYADFAQWQRQWLASPAPGEQLAYWTAQLRAPRPTLEFPADHPRPAARTLTGALVDFTLPPQILQGLLTLGAAEEATLFMTLATAFTILLARSTGQTDVIFGTPIANRTRVELEGLIGCFINTLALRIDVADNPRVRALLRRVRHVTLDAYANQDLPFEKLVEVLQPERSSERNPLFQTMFVLHNAPTPQMQLHDLAVRVVSLPRQIAELDLTLNLWEAEGLLHGQVEYRTDLFERASIQRLLARFQLVLKGMVQCPDQPIGSLPLLTAHEQQWFQAPRRAEQEAGLLHQLVEDQVRSAPDRIALSAGDAQLTYQAIEQGARRVARHLRARGIGPECCVGVCLERSLALVIALLGVLKAGGSVLPLDPAYPGERLLFMCAHARCAAVLTTRALSAVLAPPQAPLLWIADVLAHPGPEAPASSPQISVHNAASLIYTSGSTGRPRGVIVEHHSLASFVQVARHLYGVRPGDRVLQFASLSFDISIEEIYVSLAAGATLVLRDEQTLSSLPLFLHACSKNGITILDLPTAYWHELAAFLGEQSATLPASLRLVIIGGERALPERLAAWHRGGTAQVQLINTYGPTETTVVATAWTADQQPALAGAEVPIGSALANAEVYLLDRYGQPVPGGVPGELFIGGSGLARGYQQAPELTAERFVPHPYSTGPGDRLYRTGDLARRREDGALEYLGRSDTQIKIRGYRIEAGEIEAVLSAHPAIGQCAVTAYEQGPGDRRLCACLVAREKQSELADVRAYVRARLPEYMLPTRWLLLERLPLTPGGKIDRRVLARLAEVQREVVPEEQAPRTALEMQLAQIWARVLGRERVGIQENFFDLGGHSLLALQALNAMRETMHVNLAPASLFSAPTIAELAGLLTGEAEPAFSCLVPLKRAQGHPPLFCLHPAGGEVWFYQALAAQLARNQPVYGLQSPALQDAVAEQTSLEAMAHLYAGLLRQCQPQGPYALFGWSLGGVLAVAVAAALEQAGQRVSFVGLLDASLEPEEASAADPLEALGTAFAGGLWRAFSALGPQEQEQVRAQLLALPRAARSKWALAWGKERGALPAYVSEAAFAAQVALIETHSHLLAAYRPACIAAPLLVWWAQESEERTRTDWQRYSRGQVREEVLAGDHFTIMRPPHVQAVAEQLSRLLYTRNLEELSV
ncbi:MAG TPA: amino acid adenylation domain-containing protein [Ktedonobacteraceae bacterium]|jgi:amino acid adenylation domain-containing protein